MHPLAQLSDRKTYTQLFTNAAFWTPFVRQACQASGQACRHILSGTPGTFPTFIVDNQVVVKFYGPLFNGARCLDAERACARLLSDHAVLPAAALLAKGYLHPPGVAWDWPYLIFEYLEGHSIAADFASLAFAQKLEIARRLGGWVRALHSLPLPPAGPFEPDWDGFENFLNDQRMTCSVRLSARPSLPPSLISQIPAFLPPLASLIDRSARPHLIHADLTGDHLLGLRAGEQWHPTGIIDFGDARTGNLYYELAALHLDLFQADHRLLAAFLEAYGFQPPPDFARRAMSMCLLHEFDVLAGLKHIFAPGEFPSSLEELALKLWSV
jgi:hygromycin-B 7''-O-kinase